jgi:hypothetical protein
VNRLVHIQLVLGALALVVGVLAALGRNWLTASAMLLVLLGQAVGYYSRRGSAGKR